MRTNCKTKNHPHVWVGWIADQVLCEILCVACERKKWFYSCPLWTPTKKFSNKRRKSRWLYEWLHIKSGDVWEWEVHVLVRLGQGERWQREGREWGRGVAGPEEEGRSGAQSIPTSREWKAWVPWKARGLPGWERHKSWAQPLSFLLPNFWVSENALFQEYPILALSSIPGSWIWVHFLLPFGCHVNWNRKPSFQFSAFFFFSLDLHLRHMELSRLGVQSEL